VNVNVHVYVYAIVRHAHALLQDVVELHTHGGGVCAARVMRALIEVSPGM
jgi:hypothetical protein